jgi:hypothetical protein
MRQGSNKTRSNGSKWVQLISRKEAGAVVDTKNSGDFVNSIMSVPNAQN